jgi:predicted dienelactone hydrolase
LNQNKGLTAKEFEYIADSLKNEELLIKLCAQASSECQNPQLKQTVTQMAQEHMQSFNQLLNTLQQQTQLTH